MNDKIRVVIGDMFSDFGKTEGVMLASRFENMLSEASPGLFEYDRFILGPGIGRETKMRLREMASLVGLAEVGKDAEEPADPRLTHKKSLANALITKPDRIGEMKYALSFSLSDKFIGLSDHVTGQHIGGMLLMEAARQAAIAVLELEYLQKQSEKFGFILSDMSAKFDNYMFPLPSSMVVEIHVRDAGKGGPMNLLVAVKFIQAAQKICEVAIGGFVSNSKLLEKMESRKARQVMQQYKEVLIGNVAILAE